MNKMKRIFSLVLVLTMVLGSFGSVFAVSADEVADKELTAVPKDVIGTEYEKAVSRLVAFGILGGYPDGTYQPEKDVTRAEFAKILVEALGIGNAAKAAQGKTNFSDVTASHWAAGYIDVATGQGLLKGYPDGTFKPENQVTYAEAVTMLVRALGYKDEFLPGTWPGNYVAKAAEEGITEGVKFLPSGFADRGTAALMVNNTLDADVVKVTTYEGGVINYQKSDEILMTEKLGIDKVENIRVVGIQRLDHALDDDEIRVLVLKDDTMIDGKYYDEGDEVDIEFAEGINVDNLIGVKITGYLIDDLMVYNEIETPESSILRGIAYDDEGDGTLFYYDAFGGKAKYYDYASDVRVFVNNEERTADLDLSRNRVHNLNSILAEYNADKFYYAWGNVVLEKGRVVFLDLALADDVFAGVVQDVDVDNEVIQYIDTWEAIEDEVLNLKDYKEYHISLLEDGSKLELKDIKVDDRVYLYEDAKDDDIAYVMVDKAEPITDILTETKTGHPSGSYARGRIYFGDKSYGLANEWTYSLDNNETYELAGRFDDLNKILDDAIGEEVTVFRDRIGRVNLLRSDVNETSDNFGVVVRKGSTVRDEVKLWVPEIEETITYEIDEFENGIKLEDIKDNDIVKYNVNKDGTIDILGIVYKAGGGNVIEDGKDKVILGDVSNITTKSVLVDNKYYFNTNKSVYIDYSDYKDNGFRDDEDLDTLSWRDFEDTVVPAGTKVVIVTDGDSNDIAFMAFVKGYDQVASDDLYVGYLVSARESSDVMTLTIAEYGKGIVEYKITRTTDKNEFRGNVERPIVYTLSGEGIKVRKPDNSIEIVKGVVDTRSGNDLTLKGDDRVYVMEPDVEIWEEDYKINKYDLVNNPDFPDGYPVTMLLKDGKVAVIAMDYETDYSEEDEEVATDGVVTYINEAKTAFEVDNKTIYTITSATVLKDAKGNTIALGLEAGEKLNLKDVVDVDGNVITIKESPATDAEKALEDAKTALKDAIAEAKKLLPETIGEDDEAATALNTAIEAAEAKLVAEDATVETLKAALTSLNTAVEDYEEAVEEAKLEAALTAVNTITGKATDIQIIKENAEVLGLDLTSFNKLDDETGQPGGRQTAVMIDLKANMPEGGYDLATLQKYFDSIVAVRTATQTSMDMVNNATELNDIEYVEILLDAFKNAEHPYHGSTRMTEKIREMQELVEKFNALGKADKATVLKKVIDARPEGGFLRSSATTDALREAIDKLNPQSQE